MKFRNLAVFAYAGIVLTGCMSTGPESQFSSNQSSNQVASELSGGFRPNETLESYPTSKMMQRRGRIDTTGDYYNYGPTPQNIEIVPVEIPFSTDPDILLAPKRAEVLAGCNKDRVTDRTTCHMNILPQGPSRGGGLYQIVSANGTILAHVF